MIASENYTSAAGLRGCEKIEASGAASARRGCAQTRRADAAPLPSDIFTTSESSGSHWRPRRCGTGWTVA